MNTLSIVLPAHNESATLAGVIAEWNTVLKQLPDCQFKFLICEDGSTDGTQDLILALMKSYPIVNLSVSHRRGYGQAVIAGLKAADSDYILCIDSDGQYPAENFPTFWANREKANFIVGWRHPRQDVFLRLFYSKCFFVFHRLLFRSSLHDPSCAFVLARREQYQAVLPYLTFLSEGFWWGFVGACLKKKKSMVELPIKHLGRSDGGTRVYYWNKMPKIIARNTCGLLKLWWSQL